MKPGGGAARLARAMSPWYTNLTLWAGLIGWLAAQSIKMATALVRQRQLDFRVLVSTGGMPSAHTALVCAVATSVGIRLGFGSAEFALAAFFASIVMFDAQSVRRAAGLQARLLNEIVQELFREHHLSQRRLAELLGHTRTEVFAGMLLGVLCAALLHSGGGGGG